MNSQKVTHTEQSRKRAENRYAILRTLQSVRSMKRTELADYCGIRKSSVTSLIDELLEEKWVRLENDERPRSPLMMNEKHWQSICVELDTGRINIARVDLNGEIIDLEEFKSAEMNRKQGLLSELVTGIRKHVLQCPEILGIAVSVPGIVDTKTGNCVSSINLPNFNNVPIKDLLVKEFKCPVVVENDIQSSLYSSLFLDKRANPLDSAIYLDITSGVGSSILVHGKPLPGANGAAGEIGHLKAGDKGLICRCGQKDCLETYSSIPAICDRINKQFSLNVENSDDIIKACKENSAVKEILKETSGHIAIPLSAMMAALDPEVVILGNQPRAFYELLTPSLTKALEDRLNGPASRNLNLEIAREHSALRGAAAYLMDLQFLSIN